MKWGNELLSLLPRVGYVLITIALDSILQTAFAKTNGKVIRSSITQLFISIYGMY
jgi:hypothetical protein